MKAKNIYLMLFLLILTLLLGSEILVSMNELFGILLYAFWLLILLVLLSTAKFRYTPRNFFIALTALPTIRLVSLLIPINDFSFIDKILVIYSIFFIISLIHIYNLKVSFKGLYKSKGFGYIFGVFIVIVISLLKYVLTKPTNIVLPSYIGLGIIIFASFTHVLFFRGIIQNLSEKVFGFKGIILTSLLISVMQVNYQSIVGIFFIFLSSTVLGLMYFESRNLYLIAIIVSVLNILELVVFPLINL